MSNRRTACTAELSTVAWLVQDTLPLASGIGPCQLLPASLGCDRVLPVLPVPQSGELPVLPLSIIGAVAMSHVEGSDSQYLSGDAWFVYKFDKQQVSQFALP